MGSSKIRLGLHHEMRVALRCRRDLRANLCLVNDLATDLAMMMIALARFQRSLVRSALGSEIGEGVVVHSVDRLYVRPH